MEVCGVLGLEPGSVPEFGFMPRIPLLSEATERTEVDMKLGSTLFEAKLTEGDFQIQHADEPNRSSLRGNVICIDAVEAAPFIGLDRELARDDEVGP